MPRSLASCYENLVRYLDHIARAYGRQGPAQRQARAVRARLENSRMEEIFQQRPARIHRRLHRRQQPARRRHHRAISDVGRASGTTSTRRLPIMRHALSPSVRHSPSLMRIRISHETDYSYDTPATGVIQMLRLTPRNHDGQYVAPGGSTSPRLPARPARGRLRQHHPCLHAPTARSASLPSWSRARSRPRTPRASCAARSSGFRRASICARPR